ncbi:MAG: DUF3159 domain-containing protein [Aeriscardovia sp.]|nr:DUF3159 domain-containing protein [Aeriscardovia sp.]
MEEESEKRKGRRVVSSAFRPEAAPDGTVQPEARGGGGKKGFASIAQSDTFSFMAAVGGWRGIFEAVGPSAIFLILFICTHKLSIAVVCSIGISLFFIAWRFIMREKMRSAIVGLILSAIYLGAAVISHSARNYYLPAFILDFCAVIIFLITLLCRFPILGILVEFFHTPPKNGLRAWAKEWNGDKPLHKAYMRATWVWVALFSIRLVIEVPFYFADNIDVLGTLHLVLGIPLYAVTVWACWMIISPQIKRIDRLRKYGR